MKETVLQKVAILGTVGVPANYGGFETLAQNLVEYHDKKKVSLELTVYCSGKAFSSHPTHYRRATLRYLPFDANGVSSILYDIVSLFDAVRRGHSQILLLGVSGAVILPLLRLVSKARIITNVDGIEWKREKWKGLAKTYLAFAERVAVKASHEVIADNEGIAQYLKERYGCDAHVIPYGGDHATAGTDKAEKPSRLPDDYALGLCRIEPENNIHMILEAFDQLNRPLVFVGNWDNSKYGRDLKARYADHPTIVIHNPEYDAARLQSIRAGASLYVHGHSAGGTNPALVEMMHFNVPIAAHGCTYNRHTTEQKALYFDSADELALQVRSLAEEEGQRIGADMVEIAQRRYMWDRIGQSYFELLGS